MPNVSTQEGERAGKFNLQALKKGEPGITQEPDPHLGPESRKTVFVFRDETGKPQGYLHFYLDDERQGVAPPEHGLNPEVYVNPEARHQGVATKLYDTAKNAGYDLSKVSGRETTPAGAAFLNRLTESRGEAPAQRAAAPVAEPAPEAPKPGSIAQIPTTDIAVDPVRFQFKQNVGQKGVGEELKSVEKYDPELGGIISVWHDPADGKTYVVNGHHRVELAQRTGHPDMTVRYLDAKNAQQARAKGALINIAEGRGTPLDAAKVFRDLGYGPDDLKKAGISMKGAIARTGMGLANLDQSIFDAVAQGDIPAETAAVIGEMLPDRYADQRAVVDSIDKANARGKRMSPAEIRESIRVALRPDQQVTETQSTLFGDVSETRGLFAEIGQISEYVQKQLRQEKRLFGSVSSEASAQRLAGVGNVIRAEENARIAEDTSHAQEVYNKLSGMSGPVSEAISQGARELAEGGNANAIKQRTYEAVREAISRTLSGGESSVSGGLQGRGEGGGGEAGTGQHDLFGGSGEVSPPSGVLDKLSAAGKESEKWLRDNGITGGSAGANRFLDPQVLFHLTRSIAGDVARGAISIGDAAQNILDRLRDKFEGLPTPEQIGNLIRERIREATEGREVGERGPVFREFRHDETGATSALERAQSGDALGALQDKNLGYGDVDLIWNYPGDGPPDWEHGSGLSHILVKHPYMRGKLQAMLDRMTKAEPRGERVFLTNDQGEHATLARTWFGRENKTWLLTEYEDGRPATGKGPPATGNTLFGSGNPVDGAGDPSSPPTGRSTTSVTHEPEPRKPSGPVTLGSGLGAFEPFLRESFEEMRSLKEKRDAAIEELERSKITPGEKNWGRQVLHFFTGERDLWGARANQGIAKARKLTIRSRARSGESAGVDTDAEAVSLMREFKNRPGELRAFLDGTHPALTEIENADQFTRVMDRIQKLRPVIARAMAPGPAMNAVDAFYTQMAERTAAEGKRTGALEQTWNPETYVPHVLNPKGEGEFPGLRKAVGRALGNKIGKYFGFSNHRTWPTLLHAIAGDVIPKTLNVHDAFTIQQDNFATARATRMLEAQLKATKAGIYTVKKSAPEGWVPLAPASEEFTQSVPYDTGALDEEGQPVLDTAERRLYVPQWMEEALRPVTAPDYTPEIAGVAPIRHFQAYTKAIQLGLSFFHATTENYMALANMGPTGWAKALFAADRESPEFLMAERDLIAHGGTTSIQGHTVEAYRAMSPGSIPTYAEIWRRAPVVKQMDEAAAAISEFTFGNIQRRFKVTDYQMHVAQWMAKHPDPAPGELTAAKRSIAKEVNAVYGGLHWENLDPLTPWTRPGVNKPTVEMARALMLAPDWTISNLFNLSYTTERGTPAGSLARRFWTRQIVGGLIATQMASLMFTRGQRLSPRPTMVYMGKDPEGREVYQNLFFKGAGGDVTNLISNVYDYGAEGIVRSMAGKAAPLLRTGLQLANNRDYLGRPIAPKGLNLLAQFARFGLFTGKSLAPVPLSFQNQKDMLFGPEAHKFTVPEYFTTMFAGNPPAHVAPTGTHLSGGILRPNAPREENSIIDQSESGQVYRRSGRR